MEYIIIQCKYGELDTKRAGVEVSCNLSRCVREVNTQLPCSLPPGVGLTVSLGHEMHWLQSFVSLVNCAFYLLKKEHQIVCVRVCVRVCKVSGCNLRQRKRQEANDSIRKANPVNVVTSGLVRSWGVKRSRQELGEETGVGGGDRSC